MINMLMAIRFLLATLGLVFVVQLILSVIVDIYGKHGWVWELAILITSVVISVTFRGFMV